MRRQVRILLGALVAAAFVAPLRPLAAAPSGHPHFQDQGTLRWYGTWAEASAVARAEGRVVFLDMGRHACGGCQVLIERILPDARVRTRLARVAVGWAVDADRREPFVDQLRARHLPRETMLPMIGFVRPDGAWIVGSAGSVGLDAFLAQLARAEAIARPVQAPAAAAPRTTPQGTAPSAAPSRATPSASGHAHLPPPVLRRGTGREAAPRSAPAPSAPAPTQAAPPCAVPAPSVGDRISCCVVHNPGYCAPPPCAPPPCAAPSYEAPAYEAPAYEAPAYAQAPRAPLAAPTPLPRATPAPAPTPAPLATAPAPRPRTFPAPPPLPTFVTTSLPPQAPPAPARAAAPRIAPEAEPRLEGALVAALGGRRREAAQALEQVRRDYAGTPAAEDAAQGLAALATLDDLALLSNPRGPLASTLRANQRQELQGTRWVRLFPAV